MPSRFHPTARALQCALIVATGASLIGAQELPNPVGQVPTDDTPPSEPSTPSGDPSSPPAATPPGDAPAPSAPLPSMSVSEDPQAAAPQSRSPLHVLLVSKLGDASLSGIVVESDDGQAATTDGQGLAIVNVLPGARVLRLTLPRELTPGWTEPTPRVLRLEGIDLPPGVPAQLRVAIEPDGTPSGLELSALPASTVTTETAAAPVAPVAAGTGTATGRVVAKRGRTPVADVSIFAEGTEVTTTSDNEGRFSLSLPAGEHTLWVIHDRFPTLTLPNVHIEPGQATTLTLELEAPTSPTDDWVIRARYVVGGVASILEERRKASTVSDALGAEEITKSPDSSASSATRRIVGASIVGGQYLFARGLGGRYTNVRLNGVPLPSTDPDLPGFQLDLFPASLLSSLTITKTFSPDIPGDFAGGSLNVATKAFPEKFKLSASTSIQYNTQTTGQRIPAYPGGDLDFLGMDDGTRALPDNIPRDVLQVGRDLSSEDLLRIGRQLPGVWQPQDTAALPNLSLGFSVGDSLTSSTAGRLGYLVTIGYRHRYEQYEEALANVRLEGSGDNRQVALRESLSREMGGVEAQLGALGSLSYEPDSGQRITAISLLTQTGDDRASTVRGISETDGAPIERTQLRFVERRLIFNQLTGEHELFGDAAALDWQLNLSRTLRDEPGTRDIVYSEGPDGFTFKRDSGSGERLYSELRQRDYGGGLNLTVDLTEESSLKLGYLTRAGRRSFQARRLGSDLIGSAQDRLLPADELFASENAGVTWELTELTGPTDGFEAEEALHAGYAMLDLSLVEGLRAVGGARLENFHQEIVVVSPVNIETATPPVGADRTELDVLPALALILAPTGDMNLRLGYGGTVARPLVRELAPFQNNDFVRRRYTIGNPDLERTYIHNFDLRWELFPTPTEVFAISTFYKRFESPIESVFLDQAGNFTVDNIDGATNYGAELEARLSLGVVSPALSSWNAMANLALIRSKVTLSEEQALVATDRERPLAGQSPYVANVSLGYDSEATGFSAYLYYNVFGRRLQQVGRLGLPNIVEEPFHGLDATVFWKFGAGFTLGASASNLLLQPVRLTQGGFNFSRSERGSNFGLSLAWSP